MEWFFWTAMAAVVAYSVTKMLDWLLLRFATRRRVPLTHLQVIRRHRRRFWIAAAACAVEVVCVGALAADEQYALAAFFSVAAVLLFRSARRRWRRLQEGRALR